MSNENNAGIDLDKLFDSNPLAAALKLAIGTIAMANHDEATRIAEMARNDLSRRASATPSSKDAGGESKPGEDHPALTAALAGMLEPSGWSKYRQGDDLAFDAEDIGIIFRAGLLAGAAAKTEPARDALQNIRDVAYFDPTLSGDIYYRKAENALAALEHRDAEPKPASAAGAGSEQQDERAALDVDQMRAAFENSDKYRSKLLFKRGSSVFAEDVSPSDYVDSGVQAAWVFWQEAWAAALARAPLPEKDGQAVDDARDAALTQAARDVLAERRRQVESEGWTPEQDDRYNESELSRAAAAYTLQGEHDFGAPQEWPWPKKWWKPQGERRNLVKAGALILADIERIDRAAMSASRPDDKGEKA